MIKNFSDLATTPNRQLALEIIEAGMIAIRTEAVIKSSVFIKDDFLHIKDLFGREEKFDLGKFKRIKVVGFGKSAPEAALALEQVLGSRIKAGAVIGLYKVLGKYIESFAGTHPRPSEANVLASKEIVKLVENSSKDDLIIAIVSGGGSSLLCYPDSECAESTKLYDAFLKSGRTISEINTVRKHLSLLKGGGLAKLAYPATVLSLIFSDIPGDIFEAVASGPTYQDQTTVADAEKVIRENNLGEFNLIETPKEDKYFENVHNFVLVSNKVAVRKMAEKAEAFGLKVNIVSTDLYDEVDKALERIFSAKGENSAVLAAGEPRVFVTKAGGRGGRNLFMALKAIKKRALDSVFVSFASDGLDNSEVAGAIVDRNTVEKVEKLNLDVDDYLNRFDSYSFFQKAGDMIVTGPTGANVSDLMVLLTKRNE